ncbi:hypothetical protein AVKW3434_06260 [Acidovorax sp. SUPP3434]|uniref:hypothetical protein n=1 Tax=Acidovorax sp. SUPP3434 TaxID=2920880 RepID=UPI0023DE645E|nr:hypothetical protein [Acidovorax sp. SUPP3434]GKS98962.1 hypothetical protein AVKW3434_06260 [Acidovorax sp. SUPP3434]
MAFALEAVAMADAPDRMDAAPAAEVCDHPVSHTINKVAAQAAPTAVRGIDRVMGLFPEAAGLADRC